jgi:hypothetical protein
MAANVLKREMIAWVEAAARLDDVDAAEVDAADDAGIAPDSIASLSESRKLFERR